MQSWDIKFEDLALGYSSRVVLSNINATLPAGKISVILGGSGGGKSTILRHIAGLGQPMAGRIIIDGQDITAMPRREFRRLRRRMGMLFQDGALLGALTLQENVAMPLSQHLPLPRKLFAEAASRVLAMVGLKGYEDYFPNELSGGMRKRAGLARAIIAEPLILLCDEPTSGLDPITASRMDELLLSLHSQFPAMTTIVVSHDLASVSRIADYVMMLKDGTAIFTGTPAELKASKNPYLQQFLARDPGKLEADFEQPVNTAVREALDKWLNS